jgi:hypothetical protein
MKRPLAPRAALALAALALAAVGGNALAADAADESYVRPPLLLVAPPPPSAATPAMQVAIDPETGLLRPPTVSERLELATMAREAAGLMRRVVAASVTVDADGTMSLPVDPSLHSMLTVTVGADGALHYACGDAGHVHTTTATAPAAEDR